MTILLYTISILFLFAGSFFTLFNGYVLIRQISGRSYSSVAPVIGGLSLLIGGFIFPAGHLRLWGVLGLFLDYGCIPYFLFFACCVLSETKKYAAKNRILSLEYCGEKSCGYFHIYPNQECIHQWSLNNKMSSGSMIMKVEKYDSDEVLCLSLENIKLMFSFSNGRWALESEDWGAEKHFSLKTATLKTINT